MKECGREWIEKYLQKKSSDEGMWKRMDRKVSAKKSSDEGMWKRVDRKVKSKDYHKQKYMKYKLKYLNLKKKIENIS